MGMQLSLLDEILLELWVLVVVVGITGEEEVVEEQTEDEVHFTSDTFMLMML